MVERRYGSFEIEVGGRRLRFRTQPGVFSQEGLDEGTALLLDVVTPLVKPHMTILDLGTGVGVLGIALATLATRGEVWMTDVDIRAVRLAEWNVEHNGIANAHVLLSDITLDLPRVRANMVVSNPPTHSGKDVLHSFIDESYQVLKPGGSLYVVVNRLLSIRDMMQEVFGNVEQVERRHGFIIFAAKKERRRPGE